MVTFKESFITPLKNEKKFIINANTNLLCKLDILVSNNSPFSFYILSRTENPYLFNFKIFN
jgi:hypothetical protein